MVWIMNRRLLWYLLSKFIFHLIENKDINNSCRWKQYKYKINDARCLINLFVGKLCNGYIKWDRILNTFKIQTFIAQDSKHWLLGMHHQKIVIENCIEREKVWEIHHIHKKRKLKVKSEFRSSKSLESQYTLNCLFRNLALEVSISTG